MKPEEIRQLLGGYASGTLSDAEQRLLFGAAMDDQVLFDALADEQALKDLLDDPESRGYLQEVLEETRRPADHVVVMSAPAAPAPILRERVDPPVVSRSPKMWWGLLAAAALATVSVVGILRINEKPAPVEVAKNVPTPVVLPEPAKPEPQTKPAVMAPSTKAGKPEGELKRANPAKEERAADKQTEKARDEAGAAAAPAVAAPTIATPLSTAPAPPPPPTPAQTQQGPPPSAQATQTQEQLKLTMPPRAPSARQLYFAKEEGVPAQPDSALKDAKAKKAVAAPAAGALGRAMPESLESRRAAPTAKPGFAMRYQILRRRNGQEFAPVAPGSSFNVGDEVVLVIEKNSGGTAVIARVAGGVTLPVPLAMQTPELARSVPLTVTGAMELGVVLNRSGLAQGLIPAQPAAQRTEVADGMVYVAEPAVGAGQALVVRVPIRVE